MKFVAVKMYSQHLFCFLLISLTSLLLFEIQVLDSVAIYHYLQMQIWLYPGSQELQNENNILYSSLKDSDSF